MRTAKFSVIIVSCISLFLINGCTGELNSLRDQNNAQAKRISSLSAALATAELERDQLKRELEGLRGVSNVDMETLEQKVALYEKTIAEKDKLIDSLRQKLLVGGTALPPELNNLLEEFARANPGMVTYDKDRGIVKFSSDLLFNKGSDEVTSSAANAVKSLCGILNAPEALDFDIVVAGHTDDMPIQRAETLKNHPSNWHLSVHRAISVEKIMEGNSIDSKRLSVRGFGEYRPVVPNLPNKGGAEQNRRVEIYIVPQGT
ncbi:MAG: OmpA family protein [Sedimentisphaerales bacterium]|nr:OmpA family protein [Sedimentisphaerales bacterium]